MGPVKLKGGVVINGVWQCAAVGRRKDGTIGPITPKFGKGSRLNAGAHPLKLLIRFEDTTETRKDFPFFERAHDYVKANARREFTLALKRAIATAR